MHASDITPFPSCLAYNNRDLQLPNFQLGRYIPTCSNSCPTIAPMYSVCLWYNSLYILPSLSSSRRLIRSDANDSVYSYVSLRLDSVTKVYEEWWWLKSGVTDSTPWASYFIVHRTYSSALVDSLKRDKKNGKFKWRSRPCLLRLVEWVALIRFLFGVCHYWSRLDFAFLF